MRLYLTRHGQTSANVGRLLDTAVPGRELTELGRAQAAALADRLRGEDLAAIYTSDRLRAQQTAAPLAADLGLEVVTLTGLREIQAGDLGDDGRLDAVRGGRGPVDHRPDRAHPRRRDRGGGHDPLRRCPAPHRR